MQVLQPTVTSPCAEVSGLTAAITTAAGGHSDNAVDVDTVLELLLAAWSAQRVAEQQQLERVAAQADTRGKGCSNQEEFAGLVKQVRGVGLEQLTCCMYVKAGLKTAEPALVSRPTALCWRACVLCTGACCSQLAPPLSGAMIA